MVERMSATSGRTAHQRIAERYVLGDSIVEIATDERVDQKTVGNVARRMGLPKRRPAQRERNERIVQRHVAGEPVAKIAADEGVAPSYVSTIARKAGVPARSGWQRKYPINDSAFDDPTPVGWWLIGLLAADGCVLESEHRVALSQRAADADVLHAFYEYLGCPKRPLTEIRFERNDGYAPGEYREARIWSRRVCKALARHGVVPRKSKTLRFGPDAASQPAVWLGLLDGDGSAGLTRGHGIPRIDFYGTRAVAEQCSAFWGQRLTLQHGNRPSLVAHRGGLWKVALYGTNAALAARVMLEASPVSLVRKRVTLEQTASYVAGPTGLAARKAQQRKAA